LPVTFPIGDCFLPEEVNVVAVVRATLPYSIVCLFVCPLTFEAHYRWCGSILLWWHWDPIRYLVLFLWMTYLPVIGQRGAEVWHLSEHCIPVSSATHGSICVPPTVIYLPYRISGSTLTAVRHFQLLAPWPGTHFWILSGIQRAAQTVLGIYLKRTCSCVTAAHTHTHPFNSPFYGTTQVSRYQKDKTNLDLTEARDSEWQWHQLGYMQVCTLLQTDNQHPTTLFFYRLDSLPAAQPTASKH